MAKSREEATNRAMSLIFSVSRMIKEKYRDERQENISGMKLETLRYIKENKPLMKDIAEYLSITPPSATSLINHLVEAKLVERIHDRQRQKDCPHEYHEFRRKKVPSGDGHDRRPDEESAFLAQQKRKREFDQDTPKNFKD